MIRAAPRFRTLGLWLVACALAVRLIVAPGFMPVADANGFTIAMCSGQGATSIHIPGKSTPAVPGSCAFASLAVATPPAELGWVKRKQDWKTGAGHAEHDHEAMLRIMRDPNALGLDAIVAKALAENLPAPVLVKPPPETMVWTVKSDTQNRPERITITYDAATGRELSRSGQADKHIIDRAVAYGIAWHEGALFGWVNQLIGLLTALMLVGLAVSSFVLWRRRKPEGALGAPPLPKTPVRIGGVDVIVLILTAMLPMLALSLVVVVLIELLVLRRIPVLARWLGLRAATL